MAATAAAQGPRVVYVPPGSLLLPNGMAAPGAGVPASQAAGAAPTGSAAPPAPAGAKATTGKGEVAPAPQQPADGAAGASGGASLISRIMGVVPIAAGLTQAVVGLMITRGTIPIAAAPLIGGLPKFVVGSLVAATATPTIVSGLGKLLGKDVPPHLRR